MNPNFRKFATAIGVVVFLGLLIQAHPWVPVFATSTYYVDYANGCDTNDGLHETQVSGSCPTGGSGPFQHAPGMKGKTPANVSTGDGCVSNCAAVTPGAGTVIVLKGGVVWPNTVFPWVVPGNGSSSAETYGCAPLSGCIYVGDAIGAGLSAWNAGVVNSVTLTRDLCGWSPSSPPVVTLNGGGGTGATATAQVVPASNTDPNVAGCIYHIQLTAQGSGYTSRPGCSISGTNSNGAGTWATCVVDIDRPIMDLGGTQASPPVWGIEGESGTPGNPFCPQTGSYSIVYGIECRNLMAHGEAGGTSVLYGIIGGQSHSTVTHNYVHGYFVDCGYPRGNPVVSGGCPSTMTTNQAFAFSLYYPYDEASYNVAENGDAFFVGTSADVSNNIATFAGAPTVFGNVGIATGSQQGGPVSAHHNVTYANSWPVRFQRNNVAGDETTPFLDHDNETWMELYYASPLPHPNRHYMQLTCKDCSGGGGAILVSYNNIDHNSVGGASNQQQCNVGAVLYLFNWVAWAFGSGTPGWGINTTSPGTGGCTVYALNSTIYSPNSPNYCINSNTTATDATTIVVQNLHCLAASAPNPFYTGGTNITYETYGGSTVAATIQAASVADTISNALTQGYGLATLFAAPGETLTFAGSSGTANLTALCNSQSYLAPLCFDINGNQRPALGGWNAGAYQQGGVVLPLRNSSLSVH